MTVVEVSASVLAWAQRRSGRTREDLRDKFPSWEEWIEKSTSPTFRDLESVASYTKTPIGYLLLPEPPIEEIPIADFRRGRFTPPPQPSAELLDTIYQSQRRQAWYEEYLAGLGEIEPLPFVGSLRNMPPAKAAGIISDALEYAVPTRGQLKSASRARLYLIEKFENLGGLVVLNSVVGNNTKRTLDVDEFRGFTLSSATAPLVFINGRDTKYGQVFSLLHEFAHVWRGESGVSEGGEPMMNATSEPETWCNRVAAEIAVPAADLRSAFSPATPLADELDRLAQRYLCSTLVILLRLRNIGLVQRQGFDTLYDSEVKRLKALIDTDEGGGGGDFYRNQPFRVGRTLSRAIIRDTQMGNTSMTEALRLLAFGKIDIFDAYAERLKGA